MNPFAFKEAMGSIHAGKRTYVLMTWSKCGPCQVSERALDLLAAKGLTTHKSVNGAEDRLHKLDIEDREVIDDHFCDRHGVSVVPQLLIFCGEKNEDGHVHSARVYPAGSEEECYEAFLKAIKETKKERNESESV